MPELPEVETIARQLQAVLLGKVIKTAEVLREKSFIGSSERLSEKAIKRVSRKAKTIIIELEGTGNEEQVILIHLKMTGQLIYLEQGIGIEESENRIVGGHPTDDWVKSLPSKHTRVIIKFTDGSTLFFNDMRVFGWVKVINNFQFSIFKNKLPPDIIDTEYTVEYLAKVIKSSSRAVKLILLDQAKIGGLGNIYVNDALWEAGAKPTRSGRTLTKQEIDRIYQATITVIRRGIAAGGASESTYKHINGLGGTYQNEVRVYKREGQPCFREDGGIITKIKLGGRGTFYCPVFQK
jgi:formamidopyrimidine-DNA glycosylase